MHAAASALLVAGLCSPFSSVAQAYPAKSVRYIVPMSPGSGADTLARIFTNGLTRSLGQQVVVENRTGAAGNIGAEAAARAAPDGYTVFQVSMTHTANASLYTNLTYDLVRDFAPVTLIAFSPSALVVHPSLPVRSVADLVKLAKSRPGRIHYASTGLGSATFIAGELFKERAGIDLAHVPYRGGGESLTSVVTGETSVYIGPLPAMVSLVRDGRLRVLAVTTVKRLPNMQQYPTVAESYPGYETGNWYGVLVPAKTSGEIVTGLHKAALAALKDAPVAKRMGELGYIAIGNAPDAFGAHVRSEIDKLAKVLAPLRGTVQ